VTRSAVAAMDARKYRRVTKAFAPWRWTLSHFYRCSRACSVTTHTSAMEAATASDGGADASTCEAGTVASGSCECDSQHRSRKRKRQLKLSRTVFWPSVECRVQRSSWWELGLQQDLTESAPPRTVDSAKPNHGRRHPSCPTVHLVPSPSFSHTRTRPQHHQPTWRCFVRRMLW
jgi:hypothetical protein